MRIGPGIGLAGALIVKHYTNTGRKFKVPGCKARPHTKYMGLGSLIHFVWGFLSHTFCMGISLIHFVWGLLQLLELGRAAFNSVDLADAYQ